MADNYLERKQQELAERVPRKKSILRVNKSLNDLLLKNRSHRAYDPTVRVTEEQLMEIISVNDKIPSARNQQVLRFRLVYGEEARVISEDLKLGSALPELKLPAPGTAPTAYIIICSDYPNPTDRFLNMDIGISSQSMLLKAVEIGLNGIMIGAFNKEKLRNSLMLDSEPLLMLGIGLGIEHIQILHVCADSTKNYYRKDGIHFVPKITVKELIKNSKRKLFE